VPNAPDFLNCRVNVKACPMDRIKTNDHNCHTGDHQAAENLGRHAGPSSFRAAAHATLHCLTGCMIGELIGLMIGVGSGLHPYASMGLSL
jgi:hypothetical protein